MELGKHLGKGLWGIADKALPVAYGLGYVWLVIRVLPEQEFANFVLLQEIFLIATGLAAAIALQPMVKYASEASADTRSIAGAAFILHGGVLATAAAVTLLAASPLAGLLNAPGLDRLLLYLPVLYAASCIRNFALAVLQAEFRIREIFWIDSIHFLGVPFLVWVVSRLHEFDSAMDLVAVNAVTLTLSSLAGLALLWRKGVWTVRTTRTEIRRLARYGAFVGGNSATTLLSGRADTFFLAAFTGPAEVAVYNAAKIFTKIFEMVAQAIQMFLLPAASRFSSPEDRAGLTALVEKAILFSTILVLPALAVFLLGPSLLIDLLYGGRYVDAIPIIRIFAFLSLGVPLLSVTSTVLLGLGHARRSLALGVEMLVVSCLAYVLLIPPMGGVGTATAFVVATCVMALRTSVVVHSYIPIRVQAVFSRFRDIRAFLQRHFR